MFDKLAGVIAALAATGIASATLPSRWWVLPAAVALLLPWSLLRAVRAGHL